MISNTESTFGRNHGEPGQFSSISSPTVTGDQRYLLFATTVAQNDERWPNPLIGYVLADLESGQAQIVAAYDAPAIEFMPAPARWNSSESWAALTPITFIAEQDGITVVEAATGDSLFLGIGTSKPRWVTDTQLLVYAATIGSQRQLFLLDVTTGARVEVDVNAEVQSDVDFTDPQLIMVGNLEQYLPNSVPYRIDSAESWLVNINGALHAYPQHLTQPDGSTCMYAWNQANSRFEDPCSGAAFRLNGAALRRPIEHDLDQYEVIVEDTMVLINTGKITVGACRQLPEGNPINWPSWTEEGEPPLC